MCVLSCCDICMRICVLNCRGDSRCYGDGEGRIGWGGLVVGKKGGIIGGRGGRKGGRGEEGGI